MRKEYEAQREAMATQQPAKARSSSRKQGGSPAASDDAETDGGGETPDESATDDEEHVAPIVEIDDEQPIAPVEATTQSVADEDTTTRTESASIVACGDDEVDTCEEIDALQRIRRTAAIIARGV